MLKGKKLSFMGLCPPLPHCRACGLGSYATGQLFSHGIVGNSQLFKHIVISFYNNITAIISL